MGREGVVKDVEEKAKRTSGDDNEIPSVSASMNICGWSYAERRGPIVERGLRKAMRGKKG